MREIMLWSIFTSENGMVASVVSAE